MFYFQVCICLFDTTVQKIGVSKIFNVFEKSLIISLKKKKNNNIKTILK